DLEERRLVPLAPAARHQDGILDALFAPAAIGLDGGGASLAAVLYIDVIAVGVDDQRNDHAAGHDRLHQRLVRRALHAGVVEAVVGVGDDLQLLGVEHRQVFAAFLAL